MADFDAAMAKMKALDEDSARAKLRDQFAMAALTGLLVSFSHDDPHLGVAAYQAADALLAAREAK